ncbi:hypothetical protein N7486_008689 [Penicillium sp. IBT 16267x]|nr:hypothetical protein N7486_008689 [Penicillium sp. IBT 16267x]
MVITVTKAKRHCRGLPLGYLNQLEQRLAETEAALYGALVTLRAVRPSAVVQASAKGDGQRQKSGRMEEWAQYPLQNWTGIEHWMAAVSDQYTVKRYPIEPFGGSWGQMDQFIASQNSNKARSPEDGEAHGSSAYTGQLPGDDHIRNSHDIHIRPRRMNLSGASQDVVTVGSDDVASLATGGGAENTGMAASHGDQTRGTEQSRADELSKSKSSIYF